MAIPTLTELKKKKVVKLRKKLENLGLKTTGLKQELVERLHSYYVKQQEIASQAPHAQSAQPPPVLQNVQQQQPIAVQQPQQQLNIQAASTSTAKGNKLVPTLKTKITGKPGTLKRRREMNQLMKEVHEGYREIPTFEESESESEEDEEGKKRFKIKIPCMDTLIADLDAEIEKEDREKGPRTPDDRPPPPRPYSGVKTPAAHYTPPSACYTGPHEWPSTQERKKQESYVHYLVERNKKYQKKKETNLQASPLLPRKKTGKDAPLFDEDLFRNVMYAGNSDTDNDDENTDYYFSDNN